MDWIEERPDVAQFSQQHRTRSSPRRSHTKSRNGCLPCKTRRIKCDEVRPECSQCTTRKATCNYTAQANARRDSLLKHGVSQTQSTKDFGQRSSDHTSPNDDETDRSSSRYESESSIDGNAQAHRARILRKLIEANVPRRHYVAPVYGQNDSEEILNHFFDDESPWMGPPEIQKTMQAHAARLAVTAPYLMYGMMAFSASHLNYLDPTNKKYEVAQSIHFALSLQNFTAALSQHIDSDNADSLFACAFLHSMLAFWQQARDDWDDEPFRWLRTCRGIPTLQAAKAIHDRLDESIWYEAFISAGRSRSGGRSEVVPAPSLKTIAWVETIMIKFEKLCSVQLNNPADDSVYADPLRQLRTLLLMDIDYRKTGAMMMYNGMLSPSFVDLLEHGDAKAMLMFSYWYALMCNIKQWWAVTQATKECQRICRTLSSSDSILVQDLLKWPMDRCGFTQARTTVDLML